LCRFRAPILRTSINVGINRNKVLELPGASPGADGKKDLLGKSKSK
jgi:hypothetical protein